MVSVEDLMTIGVFARRTGLSVSAIRFYASQQLLVPAKVDRANGYRLYAESQVGDGILIRNLRRLEMPLGDIAVALEQSEPERQLLVERHLRRLEANVMRAHNVARTLGATNPTKESAMSVSLESTELVRALDQVLPAAGADPELPHLMTVLIEAKDDSVRFVATDRFRLAIRDLIPLRFDRNFSAVLPAATLAQWRSMVGEQGELSLHLNGNNFELTGSGHDLTASVLPITFPDYEKFLEPSDEVTSVKVERQELLGALQDVAPDDTITISTSEDSLRVGHRHGSVNVNMSCDGPTQHVVLNGRFASDATRNAVGTEVIIEIQDPSSPVLFRSADDGTFTSRIMAIVTD